MEVTHKYAYGYGYAYAMHIIHMKWTPSRWRSHNRKCDVAFDPYVVEVTTCGAMSVL